MMMMIMMMQVGLERFKKGEASMSRALASYIPSNDERVTEPRCARSLSKMT